MTQRKIFRPWDSADEDGDNITDAVPPVVTTSIPTSPVVLTPASPSLYNLNSLWSSFFLPQDHQSAVHSHHPASYFFPSRTHPVHHHNNPLASSAFTHIGPLPPNHTSSHHHPSLTSSISHANHSVNGSSRHQRLLCLSEASKSSTRSEAPIAGHVSSSSSSERSGKPKRQRPKRFHCPHCQIAFSES